MRIILATHEPALDQSRMAKKKSKTNSPTHSQTNESESLIRFDYIKSPEFRTIHVDGAHGGPTQHGMVQVALFNERVPIPRQTAHRITSDNKLVEVREERIVRDTTSVRELDVNLVMTPEIAKSLGELLVEKANLMMKRIAETEAEQVTAKKKTKPVARKSPRRKKK